MLLPNEGKRKMYLELPWWIRRNNELDEKMGVLEWVNEQIEFAEIEIAEIKSEDPNSYAHGYEAGTLAALKDVERQINPHPEG